MLKIFTSLHVPIFHLYIFSGEYLFRYFAQVLSGCFIIELWDLFIQSGYKSFISMCFANIFSQSVAYLSIFLTVFFKTKSLFLTNSNL